jgi:hypothetical protein
MRRGAIADAQAADPVKQTLASKDSVVSLATAELTRHRGNLMPAISFVSSPDGFAKLLSLFRELARYSPGDIFYTKDLLLSQIAHPTYTLTQRALIARTVRTFIECPG